MVAPDSANRRSAGEVLSIVRRNQEELQRRGIRSAALFGSVARGEARPDSDVDLLVTIDPDAELSLLDHIGIQHFLSDQLGCPVDLISRSALTPRMRERVVAEEIRIF